MKGNEKAAYEKATPSTAEKLRSEVLASNGAKRAKNMGLTRETTISPTRDMDMRMSRKTKSVVLDYADFAGKTKRRAEPSAKM